MANQKKNGTGELKMYAQTWIGLAFEAKVVSGVDITVEYMGRFGQLEVRADLKTHKEPARDSHRFLQDSFEVQMSEGGATNWSSCIRAVSVETCDRLLQGLAHGTITPKQAEEIVFKESGKKRVTRPLAHGDEDAAEIK